MIDLNYTLIKILLILAFNIFLFMYSVISADSITTCVSFMIFLITLLPFYVLLEELKILILLNNFNDLIYFERLFLYLTLINIFIGFFLFIQLLYLFLTS